MLRNVVQRVAGTCFSLRALTRCSTSFPMCSLRSLSFHRLDVSRFSEWTETLELVRKPVSEERDVWPSIAIVVQLHEVYQGDPTELQIYCHYNVWFLTQMYARFSPRRVRHRSGKTPRMCPCPVRSGAVVCRSVDGRLRGPALGGGPARRQPDQTQAADSMALTWRRTVKASGTRPRLSPTFYARAEPSLTVQPPWSWQPRHDSAVCCGRTFREPATALQIRAVFFSHVSH